MARHELIETYETLYSVFEEALKVGDELLSATEERMSQCVDIRHRLLNQSRELTLKCVELRTSWEKAGMSLAEKALVAEYRQRIKDLAKDFGAQEQKQTVVLSKKVSVLKQQLSKGNKKMHVARAYTGVFTGSFVRGAYRPAV